MACAPGTTGQAWNIYAFPTDLHAANRTAAAPTENS